MDLMHSMHSKIYEHFSDWTFHQKLGPSHFPQDLCQESRDCYIYQKHHHHLLPGRQQGDQDGTEEKWLWLKDSSNSEAQTHFEQYCKFKASSRQSERHYFQRLSGFWRCCFKSSRWSVQVWAVPLLDPLHPAQLRCASFIFDPPYHLLK